MKFSKITPYLLSMSIAVLGLSVSLSSVKADEYDGDIIQNPFTQFYEDNTSESTTTTTTTSADSKISGIQKANIKIAKVAAKKLKSSKLKITLKKKMPGATGYLVRVYTTKKAAKNGKSLVKITKATKLKTFTIKSKKLKNKKNLYVKAKAYIKLNGKKYYSKNWSNLVRVKIK